jgi:diacylglycerol kinase family enzyme
MADSRPAVTSGQRLSAVVALVAFASAVACLGAAVVLDLPEVLLPVGLVALTVQQAWKALVHRALRRRLHVAGTLLAALGAAVTVVVADLEYPLLLLGLGLLAVGVGTAGAALRSLHLPHGRLVARSRHPVLIVNPRSGDGAGATDLVEAARSRGIRVVELRPGDDLAAVARRAARSGADCLGMAGGDGSMACVAQEALRARVPFVCVPAGTRNHLALDLGLDRSDPVAALDAFGEAFQRRIDLGLADDRVFVNNVSVGAYGEVVADEDYRDRKLGTALDRLPDLLGPEAEPLPLRFVDSEGVMQHSAVVLHVSNNTYDLVPALGFGSRPSLSDGELGVVAVVRGDGAPPLRVLRWATPVFRVESDGPLSCGVDGEPVQLQSPATFRVRRDALRVRIPRGVAGISPAARRPGLSVRTASRLLAVARDRADLAT